MQKPGRSPGKVLVKIKKEYKSLNRNTVWNPFTSKSTLSRVVRSIRVQESVWYVNRTGPVLELLIIVSLYNIVLYQFQTLPKPLERL